MPDPKLKLEQYFRWRRYVLSLRMPPCAVVLLDYYEINQGENWLFHENKILYDLEYSHNTYLKARKALIDRQLISAHVVKESGRVVGSRVTVNYSIAADTNVDNSNVEKMNVEKANVDNSNVEKVNDLERKKIERKEEKKRKEENQHTSAAPAGADASVCVPSSPSPESPSQKKKPSKTPAVPVSENPPSQADIEACISETLKAAGKAAGWSQQDISFTAFQIWNYYTNRQWKTAKCEPMYVWKNSVTGWLNRNGWVPEKTKEQQPSQKQPSQNYSAPANDHAVPGMSGLTPGQWCGMGVQVF